MKRFRLKLPLKCYFLTFLILIFVYHTLFYALTSPSNKKSLNYEQVHDNINRIIFQKLPNNLFHASITKESPVFLNGKAYPRVMPLYQDKSINFKRLNQNKELKRILLWTRPVVESEGALEALDRMQCPVTNCELSFDRGMYKKSSFVVFHMEQEVDQWPSRRVKNQRWVNEKVLLLI